MIEFRNGRGKIAARHFKCFGEEAMGFDCLKPMNIVIGRNNSGKSTMLDIIECFVDLSRLEQLRDRNGKRPEFLLSGSISSAQMSDVPNREFTLRSYVYPSREWATRHLAGRYFTGRLKPDGRVAMIELEAIEDDERIQEGFNIIKRRLDNFLVNPILNFQTSRLLSDRDIVPEPEGVEIAIESNGVGYSNAIWLILNHNRFDRDLVEITLLTELNEVFSPDAKFTRIISEKLDDGKAEIFLHEKAKGLIALSQMGSGVKTVLLVLGLLHIVPAIDEKRSDLSKTIFLLEELENNLHPSIQRRLFDYLRNFANDNDTTIVTTTHSNVVIDLFSNQEDAQIIHVTHNGEFATAKKVETWNGGRNVLDDMGVHASDLLQSNAIVWVEGPSDRIYFRRWMDLWSDETLREGVHYQCLAFGGSCNAHYSFDDPNEVDDVLAAMRVNRNAILLIDSDRRNASDELKLHTARLDKEVREHGGHSWVTKGKEVENYIPLAALRAFLDSKEIGGPGPLKDMLKYVAEKKGNKNQPKKTELAREISELLTRDMLAGHLDMGENLDAAMQQIKTWNGMT